MNRKILRSSFGLEVSCLNLLLGAGLLSGALGCSDSKDSKDSKDTTADGPQATETNVTMPSMLAEMPAAGTGDYVTTGNDATVCQGATFCDDFEMASATQPPAAPWTVTINNGSVVVDTARAFRGTQAIKATTLSSAAAGGATYKRALMGLSRAPVIPVANDAFYGRMMFYLESVPQNSLHWTFIDGTGKIPGQDYTATYRYGGQLPIMDAGAFKGSQFMANYDTNDYYGTPSKGPNTDCYQHADSKVAPVGKWACAEWFFDGQNNQMKFWLDGEELTALDINGKGAGCTGKDAKDVTDYPWTGPTFASIDMGWESYATDDERTIWIDDVVISPTKVGCPARAAAAAASSTSNPNRTGY